MYVSIGKFSLDIVNILLKSLVKVRYIPKYASVMRKVGVSYAIYGKKKAKKPTCNSAKSHFLVKLGTSQL